MHDRVCSIITRFKPDWLPGCVIVCNPSFLLLRWHQTSHTSDSGSEGWLGCGSAQPPYRGCYYVLLSWHRATTVILQGYRTWPEYQTARKEGSSKIYLPLAVIGTVVDREVWKLGCHCQPYWESVGRKPRALFDLRTGSRAEHKGRLNRKGANYVA